MSRRGGILRGHQLESDELTEFEKLNVIVVTQSVILPLSISSAEIAMTSYL